MTLSLDDAALTYPIFYEAKEQFLSYLSRFIILFSLNTQEGAARVRRTREQSLERWESEAMSTFEPGASLEVETNEGGAYEEGEEEGWRGHSSRASHDTAAGSVLGSVFRGNTSTIGAGARLSGSGDSGVAEGKSSGV